MSIGKSSRWASSSADSAPPTDLASFSLLQSPVLGSWNKTTLHARLFPQWTFRLIRSMGWPSITAAFIIIYFLGQIRPKTTSTEGCGVWWMLTMSKKWTLTDSAKLQKWVWNIQPQWEPGRSNRTWSHFWSAETVQHNWPNRPMWLSCSVEKTGRRPPVLPVLRQCPLHQPIATGKCGCSCGSASQSDGQFATHISHTDHFARTFKYAHGTRMNPCKKCSFMWVQV